MTRTQMSRTTRQMTSTMNFSSQAPFLAGIQHFINHVGKRNEIHRRHDFGSAFVGSGSCKEILQGQTLPCQFFELVFLANGVQCHRPHP